MTNKKSGNDWEKECLKLLGDNGFFATKLQEKNMGAPFDLIATKDGIFFAIECKKIEKSSKFVLSRIEPNQRASYKRLLEVNSKNYFFFFDCPDGKYFLDAKDVILSKNKSIDVKSGEKIEKWFQKVAKKT